MFQIALASANGIASGVAGAAKRLLDAEVHYEYMPHDMEHGADASLSFSDRKKRSQISSRDP